jgi:hypothetical protein
VVRAADRGRPLTLARIYGVESRHLNEQVKRNADRFPDDFMFRLTPDEWEKLRPLRSQNATLKRGQHGKYPPYAFTEHGALMAANICLIIALLHALCALRDAPQTQWSSILALRDDP